MHRCAFCGSDARCRGTTEPRVQRDVSGRVVYSEVCAELERARQAATPESIRIVIDEIDGQWRIHQLKYAAEHRRDEQ